MSPLAMFFTHSFPWLAAGILAAPALAFAFIAATVLANRHPAERLVARVAATALAVSLVLTAITWLGMELAGLPHLVLDAGPWFGVPGYAFALSLLLDRLSLPLAMLTSLISGVIGVFSVRYLHRDAGFVRFFALLLMAASGMLLVVLAGTIDLLFVGWELLGISSALLIAFFQGRRDPVENGLIAFTTYRICDIGLLTATVLIHHHADNAAFGPAFEDNRWLNELGHLQGSTATVVALLLVFAALGKSAQVPFSSWLPRAMEGPTPSSAIFYGALSIHAGAYLLLRASPVLLRSPAAVAALITVGVLTSIHGTMTGRVQTDAKNQLAYASMTQVGLILVEIGLGLPRLAMFHILSHACLRTLQFLRAPNLLHEMHHIEAAAGGRLAPTGAQYELLLPKRIRNLLYCLALERFYLEPLLRRFIVGPVLRGARVCEHLERRWIALLGGTTNAEDLSAARSSPARAALSILPPATRKAVP